MDGSSSPSQEWDFTPSERRSTGKVGLSVVIRAYHYIFASYYSLGTLLPVLGLGMVGLGILIGLGINPFKETRSVEP